MLVWLVEVQLVIWHKEKECKKYNNVKYKI